MQNYHYLLKKILAENTFEEDGQMNIELRETRSGNCASIFGHFMEWDLRKGFPAVTTKKLAFNAVMGELLWFLSGKTDLKSLREFTGLEEDAWTIWTQDCERWNKQMGMESDGLGRVYGLQWRNWYEGHTDSYIDQIARLIDGIKNNPTSRYHLVSAWNAGEIADGEMMALPPCHYAFQCFVTDDGELDLMWHQRSVDTFLGLPFNIASYAALAHIIAKLTGTRVRFLKCSLGDTHIYEQHLDPIFEQLERQPYNLPRLVMPDFVDLNHLLMHTAKDFRLRDYAHHGVLKGKLTVGDEDE